MRRDPYEDLAAAARACCRAQVRLQRLRALSRQGRSPGRPALRAAEQAAHGSREQHLRLRRDLLGC